MKQSGISEHSASENASTLSGERTRLRDAPMPGGKLYVVYSPDAGAVGRAWPLAARSVSSLGRHPQEHGIRIRDPRMSRTHARIAWNDAEWAFRLGDAGSANGSSINGVQVDTGVLSDGDVVRCGDSLFVLDLQDALAQAERELDAVAPSHLTVLLLGETGVGKEVAARRVHAASGRRGAFVAVNCAALPRDLIASELFGHVRGAFSNASQSRDGLFKAAEGGTLLLDEIGDLPPEQQASVLRVLQEKRVRPVGADREVPVDVRVIAATHVELETAVSEERFREDLLSRISQSVVRIPALRERRASILQLAAEFADSQQFKLRIDVDAAEALLCWHWPRNVRELRALVEHFCVTAERTANLDVAYLSRRSPAMLAPRAASSMDGDSSSPTPDRREQLVALLAREKGNISAVARALGKPRVQVYRWLERYGIPSRR